MPNVMAAPPSIGGALCSTPQSLADAHYSTAVQCTNTAKIEERKTWTQSECCTWQNSVTGQEPQKMCIECTSPGDGQTSCKVWLATVQRRRCSNKTKTRNPLKFAGVPQTNERISAPGGPKFTILWRRMEKILFNIFFRLSIHALVVKIWPDKVVQWCPDGQFLAIFGSCISSQPRAAHFRPAF